MVYDHMVKVNGKYYHAGEDVPEIDDMAGDENYLPFSDDDITLETKEDKQYTKTEINRMSTAELQNLAAAEGIESAFETSGNELKKILAEHFGL